MAYKSCAAKIAASIQQDCNRPLVGGYTGRAVIMAVLDFTRAEVVRSADNPRKIMSIVLPPDGSVMAYTIDNVFSAPFSGSTTAGNTDNGRNGYLKTLSVRVPMRGADVSMKVIEPLVKSAEGFVVIAEKRDKVGDGSYEVIGYQNALRGDIAGVTRDESANGGDWIVPLTTVESWAEVDLVGAAETYESAKKEFEGLFGFEPMITKMVITEGNDSVQLSADGLVIVEYMQDGEKVRNTYGALADTYVPVPADIEVTIYGRVTAINPDKTGKLFSSIDVSNNPALTYLDCYDCNGLTSLDLSKNVALTVLNCSDCTGLTSLDLSNNPALTHLDCYGCTGLTSLDLSKNTALTKLECSDCTGLTSLEVSKNAALTNLVCIGCTGLTSLDVSKNAALTLLYCGGCTGLTSLDVSKNNSLIQLDCSDCAELMLIDIQNTLVLNTGIVADQSMTNLTTLQVAGTSAWAYRQVENWLSDYAPNDGKIYVDENTPQAVITAAEAKDWEVIYQS